MPEKSRIMKTAWRTYLNGTYAKFSEALKVAWSEAKATEILEKNTGKKEIKTYTNGLCLYCATFCGGNCIAA